MSYLSLLFFSLLGCQPDGQKFISAPDYNSDISIPFQMNNEAIKPLYTLVDATLQTELSKMISTIPKWKRLVDKKKLAVGLVLLNDTNHIKFARLNGNEIMYAASGSNFSNRLISFSSFARIMVVLRSTTLRVVAKYSFNRSIEVIVAGSTFDFIKEKSGA